MLSLTALALISTILVPDNYKTIQEAVSAASPGDTILVSEGTYQENIVVTKPLAIRSRKGAEHTTVRAAVPAEPVFKLSNVDGAEVAGFTATGSLLAGIYLNNSTNTAISGNRAIKNSTGIFLHASGKNRLTGNSADSNGKYGIYLEASHGNSLLKNNANTNNDNGIFLSYSNDNNLTDNNANLNVWNGVLLWDSRNNTLKENRTWRNRFGIVIGEGNNNSLVNNSTWSNIYIIMPLVLVYLGIISYLIQKRILRTIHRV